MLGIAAHGEGCLSPKAHSGCADRVPTEELSANVFVGLRAADDPERLSASIHFLSEAADEHVVCVCFKEADLLGEFLPINPIVVGVKICNVFAKRRAERNVCACGSSTVGFVVDRPHPCVRAAPGTQLGQTWNRLTHR